jgi:hypothetical protein
MIALVLLAGCGGAGDGGGGGIRTSEVTVTLDRGSNIGGVSVTIDYDETKVSLDEANAEVVQATGNATGSTIIPNDSGSAVTIGLINANETGFNAGEIMKLRFTIIGSPDPDGNAYQITALDVADINGISISPVDAELSVTNH